jgi:hypothetical protein
MSGVYLFDSAQRVKYATKGRTILQEIEGRAKLGKISETEMELNIKLASAWISLAAL